MDLTDQGVDYKISSRLPPLSYGITEAPLVVSSDVGGFDRFSNLTTGSIPPTPSPPLQSAATGLPKTECNLKATMVSYGVGFIRLGIQSASKRAGHHRSSVCFGEH